MGQSSSRRPAHTPAPTTESMDSVGSSSPSSQGDSQIRHLSEGPESRRSSTRRSPLSFVRSGNIRRRVDSAMSNPGDYRRSWRHSKRWSKAPAISTSSYDVPLPSSSTSLPVAGPSTADKGKQPERNISQEDDDEEEYHEAVEEQPVPQSVSVPAPDIVAPADRLSSEDDERTDHPHTADPVPTLTQEPVVIEAPDNTIQPPTPRPSTIPLPPRQFPPPGTLVIVQGVVHTTDISSTGPQAGSAPPDDPNHHSRTRDRLSSLLRPPRPSSSIEPDPPTRIGTPPPVESPELITETSTPSTEQSAQTALTTSILDEPSSESRPPLSTAPETAPENRLPSISSSSIDVLGTLLRFVVGMFGSEVFTHLFIQCCSSCDSRFSANRFI